MNNLIWVIRNDYLGAGDFPQGPSPENAGLIEGREYLVLKIDYDERYDEAVLLIVNDLGEIWSLSNRHLRVSSVYRDNTLIYSLASRDMFVNT
jgi:hypothetical protein